MSAFSDSTLPFQALVSGLNMLSKLLLHHHLLFLNNFCKIARKYKLTKAEIMYMTSAYFLMKSPAMLLIHLNKRQKLCQKMLFPQ